MELHQNTENNVRTANEFLIEEFEKMGFPSCHKV